MITKKDFIKISQILNNLYSHTTPDKVYRSCINDVVEDLSNYFEYDNPNFDKKRFKEACLK